MKMITMMITREDDKGGPIKKRLQTTREDENEYIDKGGQQGRTRTQQSKVDNSNYTV